MKPKMESNPAPLAVIGIDIGKDVFHMAAPNREHHDTRFENSQESEQTVKIVALRLCQIPDPPTRNQWFTGQSPTGTVEDGPNCAFKNLMVLSNCECDPGGVASAAGSRDARNWKGLHGQARHISGGQKSACHAPSRAQLSRAIG